MIQTAEKDLINGIKSGEIDPVQMEDMVRNTNLAQPAKDHLINTIRSIKPDSAVTLAEPVKVPELLQRPVSPTASNQGGSFFTDAPVLNFFDTASITPSKQPLKKEKAAQVGYSVAVLTGKDANDMQSIAADVASDLGTVGASQYVEELKRTINQEEANATHSSLWENLPFLNTAAEEPAYARELEAEAKENLQDIQTKNDTARLVAETVSKLTPDQKRIFDRYDFMTDEVMRQQTLDQILSRRSATDVENATLWDWVASFGPQYPVTSRQDQATIREVLADRIGLDPSNYVFKSDDADAIREFFTDRNITVGQLRERLDQYQAVMDELDTQQLGVNPLYSAETIDVILDGLRNKDDAVSLGNIYDAVDATVLGGEVRGLVKALNRVAGNVTARVFGQLGAASKVATKEQIAVIEEEIRKVIDFGKVTDSGLLTKVPEARSKLSVSVSEAITNRGSTLDILAAESPAVARQVTSNMIRKNPEGAENLGATAENLVERVIPTPEDGLGFHVGVLTGANHTTERLVNQFNQELDNLNPADLLIKDEQEAITMKWADNVTKNTQGTLYSTHSSVDRVTDTGDFVVRGVFGADVDGGYASREAAEAVVEKVFGGEGVIKVREKGSNAPLTYDDSNVVPAGPRNELEYFIETTSTVRPDSSYAMPFKKDYGIPMSFPLANYVQSWSKRLKKDLFDNITAYADRATRISGIQRQMLDPVLKLGKSDEQTWINMLLHGDENAVEFSTKEMAEQALGRTVSPKAWEAYTATRAYYDSVAAVRQRAVYKHLNQNGYKTLTKDGEIVKDLNGQLHIRPIYEQPQIISRPADNSDELFAPSNVWGKEIYDLNGKKAIELTADLITKVYQEGRVIARVSREAEFVSGSRFDFVIVTPEDAKTLTRTPMSIRPGHVDLNYKAQDNVFLRFFAKGNEGGNAFKVDKISTKRLNGETVPSRGAIGIYADLRQAMIAREGFINEELAALGADASAADIKRVMDSFPEPVLTREGLEQFGLDTVGTFGGLPAHSRMRGERLMGPNGYAEAMDVPDSLSRSVAETRRLLNVDAIETMRRRWAMTYGKHIEGYNGWSADFDSFQWKQSAAAVGIHKEARRMHDAIENLDHALSNRDFMFFQKKIVAFANELINKGGPIKRFLGSVIRDMSTAQLDNEIKKLSATMLISTRMLFQVLGNLAQVNYLAVQSPKVFAKDTIRRTFAMMIASAGLKIDTRVMDNFAARISGMSVDQFRQHVKNYMESGIARSAAAQDLSSALMEAGKIEAGRHNATSATFWKRMVPGLGGVERAGRVLMIPQHVATDIANMFAWNHALSLRANAVGLDKALSRAENRTVAADTRRLTFNQNRTDQFAYQQNWLSMQFMFIQHVHRMYMDLIVDPALRVATGNKLSVSRDGTNLYADTYAQSLTTMGMMIGIWGAGIYNFGSYKEPDIAESLQQYGVTPEMVNLMFDGLIAQSVDNAFGQEYDVQSRFSPAGALQSTIEMMFGNDGELILGGPANRLWKTGQKLVMLRDAAKDASPMERELIYDLTLSTAASALSGTNDIYRAKMAASIGSYVDSSGRPVASVADDGWLPILFSVRPEAVDIQYDTSAAIRNSEDYVSEINKLANRMAMSMVADSPDNPDTVVQATIKALKAIDLLAGDKRIAATAKDKFLRQQAFDTDGVLYNNAEKILGTVGPNKAKELLLELKRVNPESAKMIDMYLEANEEQ